MRVLILGGGGMLGHQVWRVCRNRFDGRFDARVAVRTRLPLPLFEGDGVVEGFDATDFPAVGRLVADAEPEVVVNCIGIIKQLAEAHDPIASIGVNSLFPHVVARACTAAGARLITIGTDCVFSGRRGGYAETDLPDPPDLYGRSKLLGEVDEPHLTLRTSIVGRELRGASGLLEWFLANRGGRVRGFTRAIFSGVTTLELARVIADVIERHPRLDGLWHVAGEPISKYDLVMLFNDAFRAGVTIDPVEEPVIDRSLDGTRFREATGWVAPPWGEMVDEMAENGRDR